MYTIELTRAQFEHLYGMKPDPSTETVVVIGSDLQTILGTFRFLDRDEPKLITAEQAQELERICGMK